MNNIKFIVASKKQVELHMDTLIELEKHSQLPQIWNKNNFLTILDSKWILSKLLFYKDTLIGFAIVSKKTEASCHIHRFIIDPSFKRKGFGCLLLNNLKISIVRKFKYLTLQVDSINKTAIEFYEKNSFVSVWKTEKNVLMIFKSRI